MTGKSKAIGKRTKTATKKSPPARKAAAKKRVATKKTPAAKSAPAAKKRASRAKKGTATPNAPQDFADAAGKQPFGPRAFTPPMASTALMQQFMMGARLISEQASGIAEMLSTVSRKSIENSPMAEKEFLKWQMSFLEGVLQAVSDSLRAIEEREAQPQRRRSEKIEIS